MLVDDLKNLRAKYLAALLRMLETGEQSFQGDGVQSVQIAFADLERAIMRLDARIEQLEDQYGSQSYLVRGRIR